MFRDEAGRYQKNEWTAISDIGKSFDGILLTDEEYISVEDQYVRAVKLIMKFHSLTSLRAANLCHSFSNEEFLNLIKPYSHLYSERLLDFYSNFNGSQAGLDEVESFCRLQLREDIGVKLFAPRKLKVFIGYDYLMGVYSSKSLNPIIQEISAMGLFVEEFD
ncbi:hypothetical protein CEF21_07660 [Bacillus sp. FJAT-42376]|uniref:hypothetical protein n=1 Tax=Bacillus sp. FJAT-42376 TaxID=2014076 RepID=UPI000F4FFD0A|nr:hypothetical protein [Bacillus sp. FJAT-42376]AZB42172.1 hypothetical protein CEF21_07660 [Bacillus sp. FJAT-42376]